MSSTGRIFAIIPAAGLCRRMGQSKLLLTLNGVSIIERLLSALTHPAIASRHLVVRQIDHPLRTAASHLSATTIVAVDPPDMRSSVALAVEAIQREFSPSDADSWLLVPADHPVLDAALIASMIAHWQQNQPSILVPRRGHRRGYPTLLRWRFAREIPSIPVGRGLNWLLREYADDVSELLVDSDLATADLDTPEDYARLLATWQVIAG